jgi:hypothetical protein
VEFHTRLSAVFEAPSARPLATLRVLPSAALIAAALGVPSLASAAELSIEGPPRCVDRDEVGFRLEQSLRKPLAEAVPLTLQVRVRREGASWSGRVDVTAVGARPTQRVVQATSCEELTDSLTVVIALALHSAEADAPAAPAAPAAVSSSRDAAPSVTGTAAAAADAGEGEDAGGSDGPSVAAGVLAGIVGDAGSLPHPALGVALGVELGTERWQLRAIGTLLPDQQHRVGSSGSALGAELGLATGGLLACALSVSWLPPLEVRGCAGWELGQLSGVGTGVPDARHGSKLWSAPLLDAGAAWRIPETAFRLGAMLSLVAPLGRDEFVLQGLGRVHRPSSIVGRVMLGAGLTLD